MLYYVCLYTAICSSDFHLRHAYIYIQVGNNLPCNYTECVRQKSNDGTLSHWNGFVHNYNYYYSIITPDECKMHETT